MSQVLFDVVGFVAVLGLTIGPSVFAVHRDAELRRCCKALRAERRRSEALDLEADDLYGQLREARAQALAVDVWERRS